MEDVRDGLLARILERGKSLLVRLDLGSDIVSQISDVAVNEGIHTGIFSIIGALTNAQIAFYDQESMSLWWTNRLSRSPAQATFPPETESFLSMPMRFWPARKENAEAAT